MDSARWERVQALFHQAVDVPAEDRDAFLAAACSGDLSLRDEVARMLAHDDGGASILDCELSVAADGVFGESLGAPPAFGPYRLTRLLGEGGMGVVYQAVRDDLGSVAAIKILRDSALSPARRARFASEQRILAQLNHPAIARLYDADTLADGTPWFAMEYVEGVPLTENCGTRALTVAARLQLFRDVCEAVQFAHRHLVVHRDLKPSNILVMPDGAVKLLDFGIAKDLDEASRVPAAHTVTAVRMMTPGYAAPEQMRGEPAGVQADVYALGAILYELLTGQTPFDLSNRTLADAEALVNGSDPVKPSLAEAGDKVEPPGTRAWADLDVLCLAALHRDRQRRYGSVEALLRDVDHYLRDEPLEARRDSLGYRASKFITRHSRVLSAAAAIVVAVVSLTVFYTVRLSSARDAAAREAVRSDRIQRFMLSLFDGGDRESGPAEDLRAVTLVDRGVLQARALDREPLVQADLFQTLGGIYQNLGKLDTAEALLVASLGTKRELLGAGAPDAVRAAIALGLLRSNQARFDEAEQLVREALTVARTRVPAGDPLVAEATSALGAILEQRGQYPQAIEQLDEAVRLLSADGADRRLLANALFELANTHFYAGHFDVSESINTRVLALHRELNGDRHPSVAEDLINLGAVQFERGRYAEAERYYREALEINEGWYGKENYRTASNLTMLGRAIVAQSRYDEAESVLTQALAIQERVFGAVHPRVASALNDLGNVAMRRNLPDQAEPHFRRIGTIYREVYGDKHYLVGIAVSNLAGVYVARGDYPTAERMFRDAVRRFTEAQSAEHMNTGIARIKLGRALLRQKRYVEAERETLAGFEVVGTQAAPTVSWLVSAREDLAAEYDALGRPDKASAIRAEAQRVSLVNK